jgi:hypothetical protein
MARRTAAATRLRGRAARQRRRFDLSLADRLAGPIYSGTLANERAVPMSNIDDPFIIFAVSLIAQWLAAYIGDNLRKWTRALKSDERQDFDTVRTATLTLLGLIIGFSFSMAITRYDQRKNYEEAEANAIGTEFVRADLLPADDGANVRALLIKYLDQRILFYLARGRQEIDRIDADTAKLQAELWSVVSRAAAAQPTPIVALAVSGMNDVLNSQGYTQAAWWNRIPLAAWGLMGLIAIFCNMLLGYGERHKSALVLLVLPPIVSISFFLIADIDSPRGGAIHVLPQNLISLSQSMKAH